MWWEDEGRHFPGTVTSIDRDGKTCAVTYDDGDTDGAVLFGLLRRFRSPSVSSQISFQSAIVVADGDNDRLGVDVGDDSGGDGGGGGDGGDAAPPADDPLGTVERVFQTVRRGAMSDAQIQAAPKSVRSFYERQNELIEKVTPYYELPADGSGHHHPAVHPKHKSTDGSTPHHTPCAVGDGKGDGEGDGEGDGVEMVSIGVKDHNDDERGGGGDDDGGDGGGDGGGACAWASPSLAINLSFGSNVFLLAIKIVAFLATGSMSLLASMVDSALDLVSGSVIFATQWFMAKHDPYKYPEGKARFEPIGIVLFASVMGVTALQLIKESATSLAAGFGGACSKEDAGFDTKESCAAAGFAWDGGPPELPLCTGESTDDPDCTSPAVVWAIVGTTVVLKAALWALCGKVEERTGNNSVGAYAEDHRNDTLSNAVALIAVAIWIQYPDAGWWCDPVGAILVACWIVFSWASEGAEHAVMLAGKVAPVSLMQQLTHAAFSHMPEKVVAIDTVRAYGFGLKYLVEIDIVLPEEMTVKESHDVAESLQFLVEEDDEVERAFVHIDFEWEHSADYEHHPSPNAKLGRRSPSPKKDK